MPFSPKPHKIPIQPKSVAIQGLKGTFAHAVCVALFGDIELHSCATFQDAFNHVVACQSEIAIIPVANTVASHVPYVHQLLRNTGLNIIGEYHLPVEHNLLTVPGARFSDVKTVHSHPHALAQCSAFFASYPALSPKQSPDTATAAKMMAESKDVSQASISSALAAQLYGLEITKQGIQDPGNNITRFFAIARQPISYSRKKDGPEGRHFITTVILKPHRTLAYPLLEIEQILKNNHVVHSTLIEFTGSYFRNEGYYLELVGHPEDEAIKTSIEELRSITSKLTMIGAYPTHHFRRFPQRVRSLNL